MTIVEQGKLSAYDCAWPGKFAKELRRLHILGKDKFIATEHISSTAVPGLSAKPIIDILASVECIRTADYLITPLCNSGYNTASGFNQTIGKRRWLIRWKNGHRTHHLHIVEHGSTQWADRLAVRDRLRSDQTLGARYLRLKTELMNKFRSDREAYTKAKPNSYMAH